MVSKEMPVRDSRAQWLCHRPSRIGRFLGQSHHTLSNTRSLVSFPEGLRMTLLHFPNHKCPGKNVVKCLLLFRKSGHEESNSKDQSRNYFAEKATGGPAKGDSISIEIGNLKAQRLLSNSCLPGRAFEDCKVKPLQNSPDYC